MRSQRILAVSVFIGMVGAVSEVVKVLSPEIIRSLWLIAGALLIVAPSLAMINFLLKADAALLVIKHVSWIQMHLAIRREKYRENAPLLPVSAVNRAKPLPAPQSSFGFGSALVYTCLAGACLVLQFITPPLVEKALNARFGPRTVVPVEVPVVQETLDLHPAMISSEESTQGPMVGWSFAPALFPGLGILGVPCYARSHCRGGFAWLGSGEFYAPWQPILCRTYDQFDAGFAADGGFPTCYISQIVF